MTRLQGQGEPVTVHSHSDYRHTVVVPNSTAQDSSLSWAARGLLVYMLSMPEHWRFNEHDLVNRSPMGRDHLRSIVRELEAHGYLMRQRRYDSRGRRTTSHWEVWAKPVAAVQTTADALQHLAPAPQTENPSVDTTSAEVRAANTTDGKPVGGEIPVIPTGLSTDGFPGPGFPPTENPSVYKKNNQQNPHKKKNPPLSPQAELPVTAEPPAAAHTPGNEPKPKPRRTARSRTAEVDPHTAPLPEELTQHRHLIARFWLEDKARCFTADAWNQLLLNLQKIHRDNPAAVVDQLETAREYRLEGKPWQSIRFSNYQQFGKPRFSQSRHMPEPQALSVHSAYTPYADD